MCEMERLSVGDFMQRFAIVCKERDALRREYKSIKEELRACCKERDDLRSENESLKADLRRMKEREPIEVRLDPAAVMPKWKTTLEEEKRNGHD
ncbi:MAG: hypothetical protein IIV05_01625 [Ruminococcus sp.]|nr:hypothetical protein [Ruminococcus sp.]